MPLVISSFQPSCLVSGDEHPSSNYLVKRHDSAALTRNTGTTLNCRAIALESQDSQHKNIRIGRFNKAGMPHLGKRTLQERTNIPIATPLGSKAGPTRQKREIEDNKPLRKVMDQNTHFDARHPHQPPTYHLVSDTDVVPKAMTSKDVQAPTSPPPVETLPQIQLLRAAIDLLKAHAEDAGSHIEQLRVMLSNRNTDTATRQSRQRERLLEERRELDSHRALWSTTQKVTAILRDDEDTFERQRLSDQSLGLFDTSDRRPCPNEPSRTRNHRRLIPLALASKADCGRKPRDTHPPGSTTPLSQSVRGKAGTAAIYHQSANANDEALEARIKDVEFTMPDYVGDLLSEFDSQSNAPLLPLSSPEKKADKPLPPSRSPAKTPRPLHLDSDTPPTGSTSLDLPRPLPKPAPSPKRFSAIFSSSSKKSPAFAVPSASPLSPPLRSAQSSVTSPLRSSISMSDMNHAPGPQRLSESSVFSMVSISEQPPPQGPPEPSNDKKITSRLKKRFSRLRM